MVLLNVNNVSALQSVDQQDQWTVSKSSECDKKIIIKKIIKKPLSINLNSAFRALDL